MLVSRALVDCLIANEIDTVFGIPGTQTLPLNEHLDTREEVRYVMARHETALTHQAWGFAETSRRPAATLVIPGPGDMNAMNGLKNALNDCTPLVHISIETDPDDRGGDAIHETPPDTYDNVVKTNVVVETPESAVASLDRVISIAKTPPKGPVRIGIPKGFLTADVPLARAGSYSTVSVTDVPAEEIAEAVSLLSSGETPIVIAGGGVRAANASDDLRAVAERLDAPVVTSYKGKGVLPETHDLSAGVLCSGSSSALRECIRESDVALAVGTDFDIVSTQHWSFDVPDRLVHVTLDEGDLGTGYEPTVGIVADAKAVLRGIGGSIDANPDRVSGGKRAKAIRAADADKMADLLNVDAGPLTSAAALAAVRAALPEEGIVTVDAGGFRLWTLISFEAMGPRRYVNPGSWASMGTSVPSAIGAQVANPDRPVVALVGDGGLMMCIHELHTAVAEELPIIVVALRNHDYAVISDSAAANYELGDGEYEWADAPIDFATVARGMGMKGTTVTTTDEIETALSEALDDRVPTLIEVPTDPREPQAYDRMPGED